MNETVQFQFWYNHHLVVVINSEVYKTTIVFFDFGYVQGLTFSVADLLADFITHATQRCNIKGIRAFFSCSRKADFYPAVDYLNHDAQTQFGFGIADPALAGVKGCCSS